VAIRLAVIAAPLDSGHQPLPRNVVAADRDRWRQPARPAVNRHGWYHQGLTELLLRLHRD
jgi:hypothetical protein